MEKYSSNSFGLGLFLGAGIGAFVTWYLLLNNLALNNIQSKHLENPKGNYLILNNKHGKSEYFIETTNGNYVHVEDLEKQKRNDLVNKLKEAESQSLKTTPSLNETLNGELGE